MNIIIKKAKNTDFSIMRELAKQCKPLDIHTSYTYWAMCEFFGKYSYICYDKNIPIGYIMCFVADSVGFIWQIGILPGYRGKKLSYDLIDATVNTFINNGITHIKISIDKENIQSNAAFRSYFNKHKLQMQAIGAVECLSFDENNMENEIIYEIQLKDR